MKNSLKAKRRDLFCSVPVFRKVMYILECHTIRLPIRQRIIDMFDKSVLRRIVLEYDNEENINEGDEESEESVPNTARPPDTSKTVRPPEYARPSPEKPRTPGSKVNQKVPPIQTSPEMISRRSDPPPSIGTMKKSINNK